MSLFYRYIIRGLGVVVVVGMITILVLAIRSQLSPSEATTPARTTHVSPKH